MTWRVLACAGVLAAISAAGADAQPSGTAPPGAAPAPDDRARIITPRRSDSPLRAPTLARKDDGRIDWAEVRRVIDATQRADQAEFSAVAVPTRGFGRVAGVRRFPAGQLPSDRGAPPLQVERTRLPLLIPLGAAFNGRLRIYPRDDAYAAIVTLADGASVEFVGTRLRVVGGPEAGLKARIAARQRAAARRLPGLDAPYVISRHEQGVDLSFSKFNAAYLISVSCPAPETDPRCAGDEYVVSLAADLGLLNDPDAGEGR